MFKARGVAAAIRALSRTSRGLAEVATGTALDKAADKMRARGQQLLRAVFTTSTQPDGSPMVPLVYRDGRPLVLTGALSSGARVVVVGVGRFGMLILFEVPDTGDVKAIWHQRGTFRGGPTTDPRRAQNRKSFRSGEAEKQHIPARRMLPETLQEAGPWLAELSRVGQTQIDAYFGKLGF